MVYGAQRLPQRLPIVRTTFESPITPRNVIHQRGIVWQLLDVSRTPIGQPRWAIKWVSLRFLHSSFPHSFSFLQKSAVTVVMSSTQLICPLEYCLYTFRRSMDLKVHINMHLLCQCVHCFHSPQRSTDYIIFFSSFSTAGTAAPSARNDICSRATPSHTSHLAPLASRPLPTPYAKASTHDTHY